MNALVRSFLPTPIQSSFLTGQAGQADKQDFNCNPTSQIFSHGLTLLFILVFGVVWGLNNIIFFLCVSLCALWFKFWVRVVMALDNKVILCILIFSGRTDVNC